MIYHNINSLKLNKNNGVKQIKMITQLLKSKTDPLLVDLITKIMQYSPKRRVTAFEALCHPYFDELRI